MSDSGATLVPGTRNTWVTGYAPDASDPAFVYARVRVRVRVEFWIQAKADDPNSGRGLNNKLRACHALLAKRRKREGMKPGVDPASAEGTPGSHEQKEQAPARATENEQSTRTPFRHRFTV